MLGTPALETLEGVQPCRHLDLIFLASRTCESKPLLFYATEFGAALERTPVWTSIGCTGLGKSLTLLVLDSLSCNMLLGISKCVLGISYVPGISYTAGSQVDRNSCPHEADAQRAEEDNKPENKVFRFVKEDTRYTGM